MPDSPSYRVADHGRFIATRHIGRIARAAVEQQLAALPDIERIVVDFTDVEAITGTFADEFAANLVVTYGRRVTWTGMNGDVQETVERAIERRGHQILDGVYAAWPGEPTLDPDGR